MQALESVLDTTLRVVAPAPVKKVRGPNKRVHYREPLPPRSGKMHPEVIRSVLNKLIVALEQKKGGLYEHISRAVCVAGYPGEKKNDRKLRLREDGAESLLAMIATLLPRSDLETGLISIARPEGRIFRPTTRYMAELAYQGQLPKDIKRAERSHQMMLSLGFLKSVKQSKTFCEESKKHKSHAAFRALDWDVLCQWTGTTFLLKKWREYIAVSKKRRANMERRERAYQVQKKRSEHDAKIHRTKKFSQVIMPSPQALQPSPKGKEECAPPPAMAGPDKPFKPAHESIEEISLILAEY